MRLALLAALVVATPVFADRIAKQGNDWVRVVDKPCPYASVIRFIPEDERDQFKKAEGFMGGQRYFACWRDKGNILHLYWEDGDQGIVPKGALKEEIGA